MQSTEELTQAIQNLLEEKKASEIITIKLPATVTVAEVMIVASASSTRQLYALADHIASYFKSNGIESIVDGKVPTEWVVVLGANIMIHLFKPEARVYYDLETMWTKV